MVDYGATDLVESSCVSRLVRGTMISTLSKPNFVKIVRECAYGIYVELTPLVIRAGRLHHYSVMRMSLVIPVCLF